MTGKRESNRCYFCGGKLEPGLATIPFVVDSNAIIVKEVPAEICTQCGEAIMRSEVAAVVDKLLKQAQQLGFEVSVITYGQPSLTPA